MYLVVGRTEGRRPARWISAVFATRERAAAYLALAPPESAGQIALVEHPEVGFPFFLIEDDQGIRVASLEELERRFARAQAERGRDQIHFNVYRVKGEHEAEHAGDDAMGALAHWHIDDDHLEQAVRLGVAAYLADL